VLFQLQRPRRNCLWQINCSSKPIADRWAGIALGLCCLVPALVGAAATGEKPGEPFDEDLSTYRRTEASGVVANLQRRMEAGQAALARDDQHGYLVALLRELNIPSNSQLLVASKTSPNRQFISPKNPRALYFNDRAAVAYVPGAPLLEVAASDPKLGVVFYTLEQAPSAHPQMRRDDRCLECHASAKTLDIPGLLVRSFRTEDDGEVDLLSGIMVNHRTPLSQRWGGYYVTGTHGDQTHRGNVFGPEMRARYAQDPRANGNIVDLRPFLDVSRFPETGSDIVALLVLDHQVHMQNLLTRLQFENGAAARRGDDLRPIYPAAEAVVKYMLFTDETPLTSPIGGSSSFNQWFESQGARDAQGRSLRQFDLQTRLFKYPCSFMIQSPAFEALPLDAKRRVWRRLWQVLNNEDNSPDFRRIPPETRRAIQEILTATQADLPAYWRL
jgi:hypothetical protein